MSGFNFCYYIREPDGRIWKSNNCLDFEAMFRSENRRIGLTEVNGLRVSTVFLGLDHSFLQNGPPILFETMIFDDEFASSPFHNVQERYCTETEAREGHAKWVKAISENDLTLLASLEAPEEIMDGLDNMTDADLDADSMTFDEFNDWVDQLLSDIQNNNNAE